MRKRTIVSVITAVVTGILCIVVMALTLTVKSRGAGLTAPALPCTKGRHGGAAAISPLTDTTAVSIYLPIVAHSHAPAVPREVLTTSLNYATNESWSWESCAAAHAGTEWVEWFCDKQFKAMTIYGANHPDYPFWDFCRGYFWAAVPETDTPVISATLRVALCYVTTWPTQTGQVAWHFGTWPEASPHGEDSTSAWQMWEAEPFAVLSGDDLPRAYTRLVGGTCDRQDPVYVEVPLPLSGVQPGSSLRVMARDTKDARICSMDLGTWGTNVIKPETAQLRLHVEAEGDER